MADIQHQDARRLIRLISSAMANGNQLTYKSAAAALGRTPPSRHGRAVAQMFDLLDAAACLAGVPLLALVKVREDSGEVNQKAFEREYGDRRYAIIQRSENYAFTEADLRRISAGLDDLGDRGNRAAWEFVGDLYPGDLLYRRLTADYTDTTSNAIADLGSDTPDRTRSEVWSYERNVHVRDAVLRRAAGKCEHCGVLGFRKTDGTRYLETHHVIALANDGADRLTNVIALCPNDHREAHFGERAAEFEDEMIARLKVLNSTGEMQVAAVHS